MVVAYFLLFKIFINKIIKYKSCFILFYIYKLYLPSYLIKFKYDILINIHLNKYI